MLTILALITVAVTVVILAVLGLLLAGIHREDRAPELACRPQTLVTALTRRMLGLHVRRPETPDPAGDAVTPTVPGSCAHDMRRIP